MANISQLSNEILFMILDFIEWDNPSNVLNFCHASSSLLLRTQPFRQRHLGLLRSLSTITNDGRDLATLLKQFLTQPRTALYPSVLKIRSLKPAWNHHTVHVKPPQADLDLFQRTFASELQIIAKDLKSFLTSEEKGLVEGREDVLVTLLLLILPNLTVVRYDGLGSRIQDCLNIISCVSRQQRLGSRNLYLHNLRSVTIRWSIDDSFDEFELLKVFAQLPSVRKISCESIYTSEAVLEMRDLSSMSHGALEELSLDRCTIDSKSMFDLLSGVGGELKSFHFRLGPDQTAWEFSEPFWIRSSLLAFSRHTLRYLTILPPGSRREWMGSLDEFKALQEVETDLRLLLGDVAFTAQPLGFVLPDTIEKVKIHVLDTEDAPFYRTIIEDFSRYYEDTGLFQHLTNLVFYNVADAIACYRSYADLVRDLNREDLHLSFEERLDGPAPTTSS